MTNNEKSLRKSMRRYGAAELYGHAVVSLPPPKIRELASAPMGRYDCPFKSGGKRCSKKGGVCSIQLFEKDTEEHVAPIGMPVTTCPSRFHENGNVFAWVAETLLGMDRPKVVSEVPFLMSGKDYGVEDGDEVGRIDNVLVSLVKDELAWCALEMQAVYFSGGKMEDDFEVMRCWKGPGIPFPVRHRHPDFRSSGPKRLMPQLQIKVPTLRRWGRKTAVVVDRAFWDALGEMHQVPHASNADIAWFILDYRGPLDGHYEMVRGEIAYTTLEDAVEGLTGGTPVSLAQFEDAIRVKLERSEAT